ncbi:unnamed protein product, partial [marine sediment metagenome]
SIEDLIMNDFTIMVDLTSATSTFKTIQIKPVFRTDAEYDGSNNNGIARFETVEWDETMTFYDLEGNKYMNFTLFSNLLTDSTDLELAYLFNEYLEYLDLPGGVQFDWGTNKDRFGNIDSYVLQIPNIYKNPDNHSETLTFKDGDLLVVMTVVASSVSSTIMIASAGTATALAHIAYAVVYSLMSKFAMDRKKNLRTLQLNRNRSVDLHFPTILHR